MTMNFLGKWTVGQGADVVRIDMSSGVLSLGPAPSDGSQNFNAYGTESGFILQAANGLYVVTSGDGYAATKSASDALNQFSLVSADSGTVRICDLGINGSGTAYYWNNDGGALKRVARSDSPPATTAFSQTVVTVGLATILQQGFDSPQPDLTWVNLSGADFTQAQSNLDFTQVNLTHANMSGTKFGQGTAFDDSTAPYVDFSGATLLGCSIGGTNFSNANFSNANLQQIQADSCDFTNATLTGANFKNAINLAKAKFISAKVQGVDFSGTGNIYLTDFSKADLTGASFTGASVTGKMTITGANLTGAALNNPGGNVTIYPKMIVLDSDTNFTRAQLQYIDFSGYQLGGMIFTAADMTGCNLHGANLTNTDLSYATLDKVSFTGTVRMNGANLSNASLRDADLTNAQLGALSELFSVGSGTANYKAFLTALQSDDATGVQTVFSANGHVLTGTVTITKSRFSSTTWTVEATSPPMAYTVVQEKVGGVDALDVYEPTTPAVLSNAFMVNVKLTSANLIGVNASGASIYGVGGSNPNLNSALLQNAQFDNVNLGNADFSSANLAGVSFDYAILTNAVFQNAQLSTAAGGAQASFVGANLQSANFDGTTLTNVVFTNAAFGVANPNDATLPAGVWLFSLSQADQTLIVPQLQNAANTNPPSTPPRQFTLSLQSLQQLQVPGPVGAGIVAGFKSNGGIALTSDAVLTIMSESVYWRVTDGSTHYVIFQSYDSKNYTPALGVAAGSDYTPTPQFILPLSLENDLTNGPVDAAVVAAFKSAGHPISTSAQITVAQHPTDWQVINGQPGYEVYSVWLDLSAGTTKITVRPTLSAVIAAFNNASIALSIRSTVLAISSGGWQVNNDAENPFNPVKNYIIFNLIPNKTTKSLDVYGAFMRIERNKSPTETEYFNIPAAVTKLTQAQMASPGNVCPNGDFSTTNQKNNLPYDQWLRARVTPRPPFCVPDPAGLYVCPR
jgi:uncharacterized protein YjbI with pentapeptide repeats